MLKKPFQKGAGGVAQGERWSSSPSTKKKKRKEKLGHACIMSSERDSGCYWNSN
jgi:hypothetical protein